MNRVVVVHVSYVRDLPVWIRDLARKHQLGLWGDRDWVEGVSIDAGSVEQPTLAIGANWLLSLRPEHVVIDFTDWQTRTNPAPPKTFDHARRLYLGRHYIADLVRHRVAQHEPPVPLTYFHSRMPEAEKKTALLSMLGLPPQ